MARQVMKFAGSVTKHWSRRWGVLLSLVLAAGAGTIYVQTLLAVHDTGRFELDGNTEVNTTDDWSRVCFQVTGNAGCGANSGTTGANPAGVLPATGAVAVTWTGDCLLGASGFGCGSTDATLFTGGGSKDPIDISGWAWKDGAGGLPDKDNLNHAFAARYSVQSTGALTGTCPSGNFATCEVIYFGSDRYDNSGDAQQGFWFLQNPVALGTNAVGGGQGFTGLHRNGDLLVISDFSNGGSTSTITVLKWDTTCKSTDNSKNPGPQPCADANLRRLATSDSALCGLQTGDNYCGIVNTATIPTSWPADYTDKSGNTGYLAGEFFEAGVNLTLLGLGGECFSTVVSETRSSTSTTSTLKDFVLGSFAQCGASLTTLPSATTVSPGDTVFDTATVQGTGTSNPPTPTGNVKFYMCSPSQLTPANTGVCTAGSGTQVGAAAGVPLVNAAPPAGKATAQSSTVAPTTPGRYCFRAEWPGDSNYIGSFADAANTAECFTVRTIATATVTTPSDGSGNALVGAQALGTTIYDRAVVTGTTAGGAPLGTVNFFICDPTQVTGSAGAETCAGGSALSGNPRTLVSDAGSNPPTTRVLSSPGIAANTAGVWCFRASYTPSGSTYESSSDSTHGECVTVSPAPTTTVTTPQAPAGTNITAPVAVNTNVFDKAVVTGTAAGGTPTGTVSFFVCNPSQVQGAAGAENCTTGGSQVGSAITVVGVAGSNPPASQATSTPAVSANVVGVWCFRAVFTSSGLNANNYLGSGDATHTECFAVQDSTDIASTQEWLPNDSATVTATGNTGLSGTLRFTLYSTANCTGTPLYGPQDFTLTNATTAADRTKLTTNSLVKVTSIRLSIGE